MTVFFRTIVLLVLFCLTSIAQDARRTMLQARYGDIPLAFEENLGQFNVHARFYVRNASGGLFVTNSGPVLTLRNGTIAAAVRLEVVGASVKAHAEGRDPFASRSNYLKGSDPSQWVTDVPQFAKVKIPSIRPGVDLICYGNQKQFEYDLVVAPGVIANDLKLRFAGAARTHLTAEGDLKIETAAGDLVQHKPAIWQQNGGQRERVAGAYEVASSGDVSIVLGPYDHTRPLVIDPVISYSTYLGGRLSDQASAITVDASGNAYVTGQTSSADFPTVVGSYNVAEQGTSVDAFVSKINPAGTALIYSTYLGGTGTDIGNAIAVDASGAAYVTGSTTSTDFPLTSGALEAGGPGPGNQSVFVTKLNTSGTGLVFSTYLGGFSSQSGTGIAVDSSGNSYVTGSTSSPNFPTTRGAYKVIYPAPTFNNSFFGFVSKINATGSQLVYSTFLGGTATDSANGIAIDASNDAYIVGTAHSSDFPVTPGAYQTTFKTGSAGSVFISELSSDGSSLVASTLLSGTSSSSNGDAGLAIALDANASVYITGSTASTNFPTTPGSFQTTGACASCTHAYVSKLNSSLSTLVYSTYLSGSSSETGTAIALDSVGNAYVAGGTTSSDYPITAGSLIGRNNSAQSAFLSIVNPSGSSLIYSTYLSGSSSDKAYGVAVDAASGVYLTGTASSIDFPVTPGAFQQASPDAMASVVSNAFITKVDLSSQVTCNLSISPSTYSAPVSGGSSSFSITLPSGCPWNIVNSNTAVTINGPTHGFGSATVNLTVAPNTVSTSAEVFNLLIGASTFTVNQAARVNTAPTVTSVTPTAGSGSIQVFTLTYSSANGGGYLTDAFAIFGTSSATASNCYVQYHAATNALLLYSDSGTSPLGPLTPGTTGTLSNSQCTIQGIGSSASVMGNALTLKVNVMFPAASSAITIYGSATDAAAVSSGIFTLGTFTPTAAPPALGFVPVTPCRLADTRNPTGPFGAPSLAGQVLRNFTVPSSACNIPATAQAYSLNLTVVPQGPLGYVTMWAAGQPQPLASTLNSTDGRVKSNAAIVPAGVNGAVSVYASSAADAILDINGYFVPATTAAALSFYPLTPCRVADTRFASATNLGAPSLSGQVTRAFPVLNSTCIPNTPYPAQAYSFNLTAVPHGNLGYVAVWPAGQPQPVVSTLNSQTGTIVANGAIVPAGTSGSINVYASQDADVIIDVDGYFAPAGQSGALSLYTQQPCRALDTRVSPGVPFSGVINAAIAASPCGVPPSAQAYVLNATVLPSVPLSYLTLWPHGAPQPLVSTLNAIDGFITGNMAIVPTQDGSISAYATQSTHLLLDILGYFAP